MDKNSELKFEKAQVIIDTANRLLQNGLLVRTWGNVSCRLGNSMLITPSGRAYETMKKEDLPLVNIESGDWEGKYKPSGEKGAHKAAYIAFPGVNFVIHTHQTYASAIAVSGIDGLDITSEETKALGGLALAEYGLPGTKKLTENIAKAMQQGAHTVLMAKHGALVAAENAEEAVSRAMLLEEICKRNIKGIDSEKAKASFNSDLKAQIEKELNQNFKFVKNITTDAVLLQAKENKEIRAQLDDMAQMIGKKIPVETEFKNIVKAINKYHAVLVPGAGGFVTGSDKGDTDALASLLAKSAVTARHTQAEGTGSFISLSDCILMHLVYTYKYSKQKNA